MTMSWNAYQGAVRSSSGPFEMQARDGEHDSVRGLLRRFGGRHEANFFTALWEKRLGGAYKPGTTRQRGSRRVARVSQTSRGEKKAGQFTTLEIDSKIVIEAVRAAYRDRDDAERALVMQLCVEFLDSAFEGQRVQSTSSDKLFSGKARSAYEHPVVKLLAILARLPSNSNNTSCKDALSPVGKRLLAASRIASSPPLSSELLRMKTCLAQDSTSRIGNGQNSRAALVPTGPDEVLRLHCQSSSLRGQHDTTSLRFRFATLCTSGDRVTFDYRKSEKENRWAERLRGTDLLPLCETDTSILDDVDMANGKIRSILFSSETPSRVNGIEPQKNGQELFGALVRPRRVQVPLSESLRFPDLRTLDNGLPHDPMLDFISSNNSTHSEKGKRLASRVSGEAATESSCTPFPPLEHNDDPKTDKSSVLLSLRDAVDHNKWLLAANYDFDGLGAATCASRGPPLYSWEEQVPNSADTEEKRLQRHKDDCEDISDLEQAQLKYSCHALLVSERGQRHFEMLMRASKCLCADDSDLRTATGLVADCLLALISVPSKTFSFALRTSEADGHDLPSMLTVSSSETVPRVVGLSASAVGSLLNGVLTCSNHYAELVWLLESSESPLIGPDIGHQVHEAIRALLLGHQRGVSELSAQLTGSSGAQPASDQSRLLGLLSGVVKLDQNLSAMLSFLPDSLLPGTGRARTLAELTCHGPSSAFLSSRQASSIALLEKMYDGVLHKGGDRDGLQRRVLEASMAHLVHVLVLWLFKCGSAEEFENCEFFSVNALLECAQRPLSGSNGNRSEEATIERLVASCIWMQESSEQSVLELQLPRFLCSSIEGLSASQVASKVARAGGLLRVLGSIPNAREVFRVVSALSPDCGTPMLFMPLGASKEQSHFALFRPCDTSLDALRRVTKDSLARRAKIEAAIARETSAAALRIRAEQAASLASAKTAALEAQGRVREEIQRSLEAQTNAKRVKISERQAMFENFRSAAEEAMRLRQQRKADEMSEDRDRIELGLQAEEKRRAEGERLLFEQYERWLHQSAARNEAMSREEANALEQVKESMTKLNAERVRASGPVPSIVVSQDPGGVSSAGQILYGQQAASLGGPGPIGKARIAGTGDGGSDMMTDALSQAVDTKEQVGSATLDSSPGDISSNDDHPGKSVVQDPGGTSSAGELLYGQGQHDAKLNPIGKTPNAGTGDGGSDAMKSVLGSAIEQPTIVHQDLEGIPLASDVSHRQKDSDSVLFGKSRIAGTGDGGSHAMNSVLHGATEPVMAGQVFPTAADATPATIRDSSDQEYAARPVQAALQDPGGASSAGELLYGQGQLDVHLNSVGKARTAGTGDGGSNAMKSALASAITQSLSTSHGGDTKTESQEEMSVRTYRTPADGGSDEMSQVMSGEALRLSQSRHAIRMGISSHNAVSLTMAQALGSDQVATAAEKHTISEMMQTTSRSSGGGSSAPIASALGQGEAAIVSQSSSGKSSSQSTKPIEQAVAPIDDEHIHDGVQASPTWPPKLSSRVTKSPGGDSTIGLLLQQRLGVCPKPKSLPRETRRTFAEKNTTATDEMVVARSFSSILECTQAPTLGGVELHVDSDTDADANVDKTGLPQSDDACLCPIDIAFQAGVVEPLLRQCNLIERALVCVIRVQSGLRAHFNSMRNFLLMGRGDIFNEVVKMLCDAFVERRNLVASKGRPVLDLFRNAQAAVEGSMWEEDLDSQKFAYSLDPAFLDHTPEDLLKDDFAQFAFLDVKYRLPWALSVVLSPKDLALYTKVHRFLLSIKFSHALAKQMWSDLAAIDRAAARQGGPSKGPTPLTYWLSRRWHQVRHLFLMFEGYLLSTLLNESWEEMVRHVAGYDESYPNKKASILHKSHGDITQTPGVEPALPSRFQESLQDLQEAHAKFLRRACACCFIDGSGASRTVGRRVNRIVRLACKFYQESGSALSSEATAPGPELELAWNQYFAQQDFLVKTLNASTQTRTGAPASAPEFLLQHINFNNWFLPTTPH